MEPTTQAIQSQEDKGPWKLWRVYLVRWLIFGAIAGVLQPVYESMELFWVQKLIQMFGGLLFGFSCAIVFTLGQNILNVQRARWKSWTVLLTTWMGMKFVFAGVMLLFGVSPFQ